MNKYKTLIIFDLDDTLFPTSWYTQNEDTNNKILFEYLDNLIYNIFLDFSKCGKIVIVSNASINWINFVFSLLPKTQEFINKNGKIISSRDLYSKQFPNDQTLWKVLLFHRLSNNYFGNNMNQNIISIGDSEHEYKALINLYDDNNNKLLKTVKFYKKPSVNILIEQLHALLNKSQYICNVNKNLDMIINKYNS